MKKHFRKCPLESYPSYCGNRKLINFVKSLNECDIEKSINDLFEFADGPPFEQIYNSSDWNP